MLTVKILWSYHVLSSFSLERLPFFGGTHSIIILEPNPSGQNYGLPGLTCHGLPHNDKRTFCSACDAL